MARGTKKQKKVVIPEGYAPSESEDFMNPVMTKYFRNKLLEWKSDIVSQTKDTVEKLQGENVSHPDPADTAVATADYQLELRTRDRLRKLGKKIDKALARIENGTYGYCEETGDPIRVGRLDARPIATLSIEASSHKQCISGCELLLLPQKGRADFRRISHFKCKMAKFNYSNHTSKAGELDDSEFTAYRTKGYPTL